MRTARIIGLISFLFASAFEAAAQATRQRELVNAGSGNGWFGAVFFVVSTMGAAYLFWRWSRKGIEKPKEEDRYRNYYRNESYDLDQVDAEQELKWLRKTRKSNSKTPTITYGPKRAEASNAKAPKPVGTKELNFDSKVFQEKMKMLQYAQLPINSFQQLSPAKKYEPLPDSDDRALLTAIEQANEEYEEDETIRELAMRILAAFRTRNSVEALAQIALYDLSSNRRSKAVSILTDFDHEMVFEPILLACADPTREVRAAAARGLFRLNFDRSDAWKRLIETGDEFRMSHAVRAAIEAGIVQKSFDRLVHEDLKVAYEAFTLVALMIQAGEEKEIFEAIRDHRDERVKYALLHVIKVMRNERSMAGLMELGENEFFTPEVVTRINECIKSYERVAA